MVNYFTITTLFPLHYHLTFRTTIPELKTMICILRLLDPSPLIDKNFPWAHDTVYAKSGRNTDLLVPLGIDRGDGEVLCVCVCATR